MATGSLGGGKNMTNKNQPQFHLTLTGLLMEGDLTQNPCRGHFERYRDLSLTDRDDFRSVLSRPRKAMLFE